MSNIRSISDLRRQQEAQHERQRLLDSSPASSSSPNYPILGSNFKLGSSASARSETFVQMLSLFFCPHFTTLSFIFSITIAQISLYFLTVFIDYNSSAFLKPTTSSLDRFGAKDPEKMQEDFEVWRWVTPMFLHADLMHLTFNLLMQIMLGFRLEPTVGILRTIVVYIGSAFGGVLLSSVASPNTLAVGASTAIFGIISSMLAWIMINWSYLEGSSNRTFAMISLCLLLVVNLLVGLGVEHVDNWGHLGGMLCGFALAALAFESVGPQSATDKYVRVAAGAFLVLFYVGGLGYFYGCVEID